MATGAPTGYRAALLRLTSEQDGVANGEIVFAIGSGKNDQTNRDAVFLSQQTCSAAAQCLQDMHFIRWLQQSTQAKNLFAVDENFHVRTNRFLFVNHPKSNARKTSVQIFEQFADGSPNSFNLFLLIGIRQ